MNIAYFINNNGEKIELNAYDENCRKYKNRLICPCCGERVNWVDGPIKGRYFRHHHSTYMEECENYCSSISIGMRLPPYEREGLALYLIKDLGRFSLRIGLRAISSHTIKEAESIGLVVNIENDREVIASKAVNVEYFAPDELNFIQINHVHEQYKLRFSNEKVPDEVKNKWNEKVNGIGRKGAVFSSFSYGGKKITTSRGIIINEEYLLFTQNSDGYNHIKGAEFEKMHEVNFGWLKKYYIYKFIVKEKNALTLKFARGFDLELKYMKEEIIPIWPPCSMTEDELIYNVDSERFFIFNTDDPIRNKLYSQKLQKELTSQCIDNGKYLIKNSIETNDFLTIGSLYDTISYSIVKKTYFINKLEPNIEVEVLYNNIVNISSDVKLFVNLYSDKYLLKSEIITNGNYSVRVRIGEKIEILYGLDIIWKNINRNEISILEENNQKDKELLLRIRNCKGEIISTPTNLMWQILKLKDYELSYSELIKRAKSGKISLKLMTLLKESI